MNIAKTPSASDFIPERLRFSPRQISLILTVMALILWVVSIVQAKLVLDDWGLIHSLPVIYFVALGLLTVAAGILWISQESHHFLMCFQLCFFIAILWLTPLLLGTTLMPTRYEFGYYSNTQYIINLGHLDILTQWLHSWPGFSLFGAGLAEILGIKNTDIMLIWAPLIIEYLMVLPFYLFFKNTLGRNNYVWPAIWIFFLFNHVGQIYFGNQTIAFFLLFILLALLMKYVALKEPIPVKLNILILLLFACIAITHLLTALVCIFILGVLWIYRRYNLGIMFILFSVFAVAWTMFVATGYFASWTPTVITTIFRIDLLFQKNVVSLSSTGSIAHEIVAIVRVFFTVLIGAVGFVGLLLSRKYQNKYDLIVVAVGAGMLLMVLFGFYSGEMLSRTYFFMLPVLAYFAVKLFNTKITAVIFVILLLLVAPLSIIALHGDQAVDNITASQRAYWHFIEQNTTEGYFTGGGMVTSWSLGYLGSQIYDNGINNYTVSITEEWDKKLMNGQWALSGQDSYASLSSFEEENYTVRLGILQALSDVRDWLNRPASNYDLIFSSGDVTTYMHDALWSNN
jgi:hypothetical protein